MPFSIIRNDITKVEADAIVNSTNPGPWYGSGSDFAVYEAAGAEKLLAARKKLGEIAPGEAGVTRGFDLPARYVIHTVAPLWEGGDQGEIQALEKCYDSCLAAAKRKHLKSVAFPLLSAGTLGFPKDVALTAALSVIQRFLLGSEMMVWLVVFDRESVQLSEKLTKNIDAYIDDHYVEHKIRAEYAYAESREEMSGASADADMQVHANASLFFEKQRELERRRRQAGERTDTAETAMFRPQQAPMAARPAADAKQKADVHHKAAALREEQNRTGSHKKRSLDEALNEVGETFQQALFRIIQERGFREKDVYKRANLDRKVFSKIRLNENYSPKKSTAIALAIGLQLNLKEASELLSRAGYSFSPGSRADVIVQYFIENGIYNVLEIDSVLYEYGEHMLSNYA